MADIKSHVQTATALTVTGFATLNPATSLYVVSNEINHTTNDPLDVLIDVTATTATTPTGNKQIVVFAKGSLDGTNFGSGPESGTAVTNESDLHFVGSLPMNDTTAHRKVFSLAAAYGGVLPARTKLVLKNDLGVTLTAGSVQISEVWGVAV